MNAANVQRILATALTFAVVFVSTAAAQTTRFDELANMPFEENRPTKETTQTLRDELLFQRATQTYLWALPLAVSYTHLTLPTILRV